MRRLRATDFMSTTVFPGSRTPRLLRTSRGREMKLPFAWLRAVGKYSSRMKADSPTMEGVIHSTYLTDALRLRTFREGFE